jgi:hypothetical protein
VAEGELRLSTSDFGGSAFATGWVAYDGIPNDHFDGTQGQIFADLTGAGAFDRLLIGLGDGSAPSAVEVQVSDGDSTSTARHRDPQLGQDLSFDFYLFAGIDFTDVRALSVSILASASSLGHVSVGAQVSLSRIALGPCVGACTYGIEALDREEKACVNAINRDWAHVLKAQGRDNARCVEDAASGRQAIGDCLGQDLAGKVEGARERTRRTESAKCAPIGVGGPDDFAFTGGASANDAASHGALVALGAVLGDVVPKQADPEGAACQAEVVRQLGRAADLWAAELNRAKRAALRGGPEGVPPVGNPRDLASAIDATIAGIQGHGRIEKAKGRLEARIAKKCDGVATAELFECARLTFCVVGTAFQSVCEAMELADRLELDCRPRIVRP